LRSSSRAASISSTYGACRRLGRTSGN
jgi:hypothetical protein